MRILPCVKIGRQYIALIKVDICLPPGKVRSVISLSDCTSHSVEPLPTEHTENLYKSYVAKLRTEYWKSDTPGFFTSTPEWGLGTKSIVKSIPKVTNKLYIYSELK